MDDVKLPYGLRNDGLYHIDDVINGIACNCYCPNCKTPLVARNAGKIQRHHFAHYSRPIDCLNSFETVVHMVAKQIIANEKRVIVPEFNKTPLVKDLDDVAHEGENVFIPAQVVDFASVSVEETYKGYRIDLVGYTDTKPLLVEIRVTHKVDQEKENAMMHSGSAMIEIDLSRIGYEALMKQVEFTHIVVLNEKNRRWICNPKGNSLFNKSLAKLQNEVSQINQRIKANRIEDRKLASNETSESNDLNRQYDTPRKTPKAYHKEPTLRIKKTTPICMFCGKATEDWWSKWENTCKCKSCYKKGIY